MDLPIKQYDNEQRGDGRSIHILCMVVILELEVVLLAVNKS